MPRLKRESLPNGLFHVTVRGNRRQRIVQTTGDAQKLVGLIRDESWSWDLRAYCLMPNHFHVVVRATVFDLSNAMSRINGRYAQWFNRNYALSGHLFQGRYTSKPIADEQHLYEAIRYVLLNPVRAGLCPHPAEWPWCSWNDVARDAYVLQLVEAAISPARGCARAASGRAPSAR